MLRKLDKAAARRVKLSDALTARAGAQNKAPAAPAAVAGDGGGLRYNDGKVQLELIPPEWTWALGVVLTRGAIKYATRNWERGMKWSYCVGCIGRHLVKFLCGERYDLETGCHHLAHVAWNALALMSYDVRGVGENDLRGTGDLKWIEAVAVDPGPELLRRITEKSKLPSR